MFVYLEGSQVVFATAKLIKAYIDGTTLRVILENNQGLTYCVRMKKML
jgi:hypothetical protein